jgi:hypothetical protein
MATMSGTDQSREAPVAAPDGMSAEFERLRGKLGLASGPAPRIEGRYQIHRTLGRGAMGEVHLAHDHRLGRTVALKVVRTNGAVDTATLRTRLEREALALARVDHPNVVHIFDVGSHDGQTYLTMQYIAGTTLRSWQAGRSHGEILGSYLQAARGLAAAHAVGVVHRDFKPKSRRPSQTAPQPTDRPHSHSQGRFERVDVDRGCPGAPRCAPRFGKALATGGAAGRPTGTWSTEHLLVRGRPVADHDRCGATLYLGSSAA